MNKNSVDVYIKLNSKYEYRLAHHSIFEINNNPNRACVLDLWWLGEWKNLTKAQETIIAKRMIEAYEIGKEAKAREIRDNLIETLKLPKFKN